MVLSAACKAIPLSIAERVRRGGVCVGIGGGGEWWLGGCRVQGDVYLCATEVMIHLPCSGHRPSTPLTRPLPTYHHRNTPSCLPVRYIRPINNSKLIN